MKVKRERSTIVKPIYEGLTPFKNGYIPLSVFDKVSYDTHMGIIYAYRPPTPPNSTLEQGLQRVLSVYREFAGRKGRNERGDLVILLNDEGVKFVEASVDMSLDEAMPSEPSTSIVGLHPSVNDVVELAQVQLTRFTCGSLVVGFTANHLIADGQSTSNFLVAWGKACRGLEISPLPLHDRTIFLPRDPPIFEVDHKGLEFKKEKAKKENPNVDYIVQDIVIHKVQYTSEFLAKLKAKASSMNGNKRPYSTFESLVAHLWKVITKARSLNNAESTRVSISVNGRTRLNPRIPNEYFGNLVLWAFPKTRVKDLLHSPLPYAAKVIHEAVSKVNDKYFKSFIDYASTEVEKEGLIPWWDLDEFVMSPNLDIDSWLNLPFDDLDFGNGKPFMFLPSFVPTEGTLFLLPSFIGDGSINAYVHMFHDNLEDFKRACYTLD